MTEHSAPKYTNHLIHETSPYLLQHAHNPVEWYPWGEEALQKARAEGKPILLSIGYSACHWCHVMEHESFENEEIANLMNKYFVSIKVDREERPDLDNIYMQAVQAMTGQGGWPMTMFLMPDGRPFYGGTYFPPKDRRYGQQVMPGFPRLLLSVADVFTNHRDEMEEQADRVAEHLQQSGDVLSRLKTQLPASSIDLSLLQQASESLDAEFDPVYGGFGGAPKFPSSMALEFLLRVHLHRQKGEMPAVTQEGAPSELNIVEFSLQRMAQGGIYDHLGGGFHRYSVDARWLVPHFEKMLYDNALLSRLYIYTYIVTGNSFYRRVAEETLSYVMREMTSPEGGFYSTQDADSEGEEGKFFLWTPQEIQEVLSLEDAQLFIRYYGVTDKGNFEGKNILNMPHSAQKIAEEANLSVGELQATLQRGRTALLQRREQRVKPGRDEKILTSWNGLMLRSFADAARYLGRSDYLQIAINNANFLLNTLRQDGRLLHTYKDGRAHIQGYLEDYAFLADGLLALYEATFDPRWFVEARRLMDQVMVHFADDTGGFFDTSDDHEQLLRRPKEIMDNAVPAANSVAASVLFRLSAWIGEADYRQRADDYLQSLAPMMVQHPQAFGYALGALDFSLWPTKEIAIIGDPTQTDAAALLATVNARYLPNSVLAAARAGDQAAADAIALLADRPMVDNRATAYVCQNFACQAPVTNTEALAALL